MTGSSSIIHAKARHGTKKSIWKRPLYILRASPGLLSASFTFHVSTLRAAMRRTKNETKFVPGARMTMG